MKTITENKERPNTKSPFAREGRKHWKHGLSVIPLVPKEKRPIKKNWSDLCNRHPVLSEIKDGEVIPGANIGLCLGEASQIVALDFDSFPEVREAIEDIIPVSPVKKYGAKGYTTFFRYSGEKPKKWKIAKRTACELLSTGNQTVIPPSIHPSGVAYRYENGKTLLNVFARDLPELPTNFCRKVDEICAKFQDNPAFIAQLIFEKYGGWKRGTDSYQIHCPCPNHEDKSPSCSVDVQGSKLLVCCHTGCEVVPVLKREGLWPSKENEISMDVSYQTVSVIDYLLTEPIEVKPIIANFCEPGDILTIIGKSKSKKTFFLVQALLSLAAGRSFMGLKTKGPCSVLHVQLEVKANHFHKRVKLVAEKLGITPEDILNRFHVMNLRGVAFDWEKINEQAIKCGAEVIALDPAYKILDGEENNDKAWKDFLQEVDKLAKSTGASIWIVHHDKKGSTAETDNVDRGSGRNILARHFDAAIYLSPQVGKLSATIIDFEARNFQAPDSFVAQWERGAFTKLDGIIPTKKTNNRQRLETTDAPLEDFVGPALIIVGEKLFSPGELKDLFRQRLNLAKQRAEALFAKLLADKTLEKLVGARRLGECNVVGKPEQIEVERVRRELVKASENLK
jgi:hypothetical protein